MKRIYLVLLLSALSLLSATASGFYVFYIVFYALAGTLLVNLAWAYLNLLGLQVAVERWPSRGNVGETVHTSLSVRNTSLLPKVLLEVRDLEQLPGHATGRVLNLRPHQDVRWEATAPLRKRGLYLLGPVRAYSADLFGLFRLHRDFGPLQEFLVRPAVVQLPALQLSYAQWHHQGTLSQRSQEVNPLVSTVREYTYGDSLKRIHWPSTVRTARLMVKEFDTELGNQVWIVLDLQRDVQRGEEIENTEEYAITAAASIAHRLLSTNWPVGMIAQGDQEFFLEAQRGAAQEERLLDVLAMARAEGTTPLAEVLQKTRTIRSSSSTFVIITPSVHASWIQAVHALLERRFQLAAVLVDASSFARGDSSEATQEALHKLGIAVHVVRQGEPLPAAFDPRNNLPHPSGLLTSHDGQPTPVPGA